MRDYKREDLPWALFRVTVFEGAEKSHFASWFSRSEFLSEFEMYKTALNCGNDDDRLDVYANAVSELSHAYFSDQTRNNNSAESFLRLAYLDLKSLSSSVESFMKLNSYCPFLGKAILATILGAEAASFTHELKRAKPSKVISLLRGMSKEYEQGHEVQMRLYRLYQQTLEPALSYSVLLQLMINATEVGCHVSPMAFAVVEKAIKVQSI